MKNLYKLPMSLALAGVTFAGLSFAQDWYVSGSVSWNDQAASDVVFQEVTAPGVVMNTESRVRYDEGIGVGVELGRHFNRIPGLRGSLEVAYTKAEVDNLTTHHVAGSITSPASGDIENLGFFANAYYDVNLNLPVPVKPYVGAGIGFTQGEVRLTSAGATLLDDDDTRFAYQAKAGASYALNSQTDFFAEYTFRESEELTFGDPVAGEFTVENRSHLVGVGLRMRF